MCLRVCVCVCHGVHMEIRGQFVELVLFQKSLLCKPLCLHVCGFQEFNTSCQACTENSGCQAYLVNAFTFWAISVDLRLFLLTLVSSGWICLEQPLKSGYITPALTHVLLEMLSAPVLSNAQQWCYFFSFKQRAKSSFPQVPRVRQLLTQHSCGRIASLSSLKLRPCTPEFLELSHLIMIILCWLLKITCAVSH